VPDEGASAWNHLVSGRDASHVRRVRFRLGMCVGTHRSDGVRACSYNHPCIMDLKMGTSTAEADARIGKKLRMGIRDQITASAQDGVQLVAMHLYRSSSGKQLSSSKAAVRATRSNSSHLLRLVRFVLGSKPVRTRRTHTHGLPHGNTGS
jgi:hypothetical protein